MNRIIVGIMLTLVLVSVIAIGGCDTSQAPEVGKQAPDFEFQTTDGEMTSLNQLRGKLVLINFWASWCRACVASMPFIQTVHDEWPSQELVVIAINVGESPGQFGTFLQNNNFSFLVLLDTQRQLSQIYNIHYIPTSFFVVGDGIIRDIKFGSFANQSEIEWRLGRISPAAINQNKEE